MDTSEYLPMFLAECREHLQELNTAVVRLEESPEDRATLDEIFRAAHSLKGMSATMGFDGVARLTHQMEDVFELLRQRQTALPPAVVDVLLEVLDALEAAIDAIEASGSESIDPDRLIARLAALVREDDEVEHPDAAEAAAGTGPPMPDAAPELAEGERLVHVTATLSDEVMMPSVRAFMVINALGEHGTVVATRPADAEIESFQGRTVESTVVCACDADVLGDAVAAVEDVVAVEVAFPEVDEAGDESDESPALTVVPDDESEQDEQPAAEVPAAPDGRPGPAPVADEPAGAAPKADAPKRASTVRVDAERLDQLMHSMGELVVQRTHVEAIASEADVPGLAQAMQELTRCSHSLQSMVMQIRMIPVEAVFLRFPRLVRDVSSKLGKQVDLEIVGQETELDRSVVDALGDPLVHLIRNSLDHGLEPPEERVAAGKDPVGTLSISARHSGGSIVIAVSDDGRGIDPAKVGERAVERGLISADQAGALDVAGAIELLFAPGFSTAETVGDLSGRGVGMDAVRTKIRSLGGEVVLTAEPGQGTTAEIRLPLTLAIMSALLVEVDGLPYGLALGRVERTMRMQDVTIRSVAGAKMLVLDEDAVPLVRGRDVFGHKDVEGGVGGVLSKDDTHVVLVRAADRTVALGVSALIGQHELVTRPLPPGIADGCAVSGAAVLSSGAIVLLADCDALAPAIHQENAVR